MSPPSVFQHVRQILGRSIRETGQAFDRLALRAEAIATTRHDFFDDAVKYQDHLSRHRHEFPLITAGKPLVSAGAAYIAPCSTLIGAVTVHPGASIWYGAVLRADEGEHAETFKYRNYEELEAAREQNPDDANPLQAELHENRFRERFGRHGGSITVGADSNIQDGCIITARTNHTVIGQGVTVGHLAQIHSATIGDFALIGMGSVVQAGAVIESEALVAAGAIVEGDQVVKAGELWVGNPAHKVRDLSAQEREKLHYQSSEYVKVAAIQAPVQELGGNLANRAEMDEVIIWQAEGISLDAGPPRIMSLEDVHNPVEELPMLPPPPESSKPEQLSTPESPTSEEADVEPVKISSSR